MKSAHVEVNVGDESVTLHNRSSDSNDNDGRSSSSSRASSVSSNGVRSSGVRSCGVPALPAVTAAGDAHGVIEFVIDGTQADNEAKFIRVNKPDPRDEELDDYLKFFTTQWKIPNPTLILSITGGAKDFVIPNAIEKAFQNSIRDLVQHSPGIMVTSGGTNAGVMKLVGKAMKNYNLTRVEVKGDTFEAGTRMSIRGQLVRSPVNVASLGLETSYEPRLHGTNPLLQSTDESPITCIGIATWGIVTGRENLASAAGKAVEYQMEKEPSGKKTYLDPNHTHHLLVDDGSEGEFGREITFRTKLENCLTRRCKKTTVTAPIVSILIEGGPNSLKTTAEALQFQTPCIILKGTGRAADVLAEANAKFEEWQDSTKSGKSPKTFQESARDTIIQSLKQRLSLKEEHIEKHLQMVFDCLLNREYLHVFEVGDGTDEDLGANSLAEKIVDAFLDKDQKEISQEGMKKESLWRILCLSFRWNHQRAAKKILETASSKHIEFDKADCRQLLVHAIKAKKLDFIEVFLDSTHFDLRKNYAEIMKQLFDLEDGHEALDLKLRDIVGEFWSTESESHYQVTKHSPCNLLFIYAVSKNDMDLAKFFLKKVKYPIACALIACNILRRLIHCESVGEDDQIQNHIKEFEDIAYGLLTECNNACPIRTRFILLQEIASLGSVSVLQLAIQGSCLKFISHKVCQQAFQQMWYGGFSPKISWFRLNFANLFFPLAPFLLSFDSDDKDRDKDKDKDRAMHDFKNADEPTREQLGVLKCIGIDIGIRHPMSYRAKVLTFLESPRIKFGFSIFSYLALLSFFSVVIFNESEEFTRPNPSFAEWTLFLFWFHFFLQEINQIVANGTSSSWSKFGNHLKNHLSDRWNVIDAIINVLIIASVIMRMIPKGETEAWGLFIKMMYCFIYLLFWLRMLHVFMLTSFLGPKLVMVQMMLKDLVYVSFCFLILGTSYSIVSYSLEASLAHECCGGNEANNYSSIWTLANDLFDTSWWNLFGEVGDFNKTENMTNKHAFFEFMQLILLPGMKGCYMLISGIILLNLLIAMFSFSFTSIQDQSYRIWCFNKHDLIFEYYDRSKLPAPLAIVSLIKRFIFRTKCCKRFRSDKFISSKRNFKVRLQKMKEVQVWKDEGKWSFKYAKTLKRWEQIVANNYWLTHKEAKLPTP